MSQPEPAGKSSAYGFTADKHSSILCGMVMSGPLLKRRYPMNRATLPECRSVTAGLAAQVIERAAPEDLRLLVLDCPLQTWNDEGVRDLFGEVVALKKLGFSVFYRDNVLPVDTTDFVGRHYLSCIKVTHGFQVVAAFRAVDLERCRSFNLAFPALSLTAAANAPLHCEAV